MTKFDKVFAVPGEGNIIDVVTDGGLSACYHESLEQVRIRYPKAEVLDYDDWAKAKAACQDTPITWEEITEDKYSYYLEVLPPIAWKDGAFLVGEPWDHHAITGMPRYQACKMVGNKFYASNRPLTRIELKNELAA